MEEENNLICIYDNTKGTLAKLILDIYANFVEGELNDKELAFYTRQI